MAGARFPIHGFQLAADSAGIRVELLGNGFQLLALKEQLANPDFRG